MNSNERNFDLEKVEVEGCQVRLIFMAESEEQAQRVARAVSVKVKGHVWIEPVEGGLRP